MSSLPNYLRTHRKSISLSQEEVAFLVGTKGMNKGGKVSRDENYHREPTLLTALAYEALYQKPIRELFAGLYEEVEKQVLTRAKILNYRSESLHDPQGTKALNELALRHLKSP